MMGDQILQAIQMVLLDPVCLLLILLGVVVGIIFGAVPGLSSTMALILFLPMSFGMEPMKGIALLDPIPAIDRWDMLCRL